MKKMSHTPIQTVGKTSTGMGKVSFSAKTGGAKAAISKATAGGKICRK